MTPATIKRKRQALALSRAELAALLGVSPVTIEKWEQGTRRPCCQFMREELEYLLDGGK